MLYQSVASRPVWEVDRKQSDKPGQRSEAVDDFLRGLQFEVGQLTVKLDRLDLLAPPDEVDDLWRDPGHPRIGLRTDRRRAG